MDSIENAPISPEQKARARFLEDFAEMMKLAQFRRWLFHLIEDSGWCGSGLYGADFENPNKMYFAAAKRELGVELNMTAMAVADELYMKMVRRGDPRVDNHQKMLDEARNLKLTRELRAEVEKDRDES